MNDREKSYLAHRCLNRLISVISAFEEKTHQEIDWDFDLYIDGEKFSMDDIKDLDE